MIHLARYIISLARHICLGWTSRYFLPVRPPAVVCVQHQASKASCRPRHLVATVLERTIMLGTNELTPASTVCAVCGCRHTVPETKQNRVGTNGNARIQRCQGTISSVVKIHAPKGSGMCWFCWDLTGHRLKLESLLDTHIHRNLYIFFTALNILHLARIYTYTVGVVVNNVQQKLV